MSSSYYVGIDLHKRSFTFVIMDASGQVSSQGREDVSEDSIVNFAARLTSSHSVVVEPVVNTWWFLSLVSPYVGSIHVAHPYKVRLIAQSRTKTDRYDARVLADLLRVGYLPEAYQPSPDILSLRRLVSYRVHLVRDRTRVKNRLTHLFAREGISLPGSDPFGKAGRLKMETVALEEENRLQADGWLTNLAYLDVCIKEVGSRLVERGQAYPAYAWLLSIPGIGPVIATSVIAYVGDMSRFPNARSFARYTGLTPSHRDSGERQNGGGITHEGPSLLRWVLLQAEPHYRKSCKQGRALYARICYRSSAQKAKVAVAHRLARIIFAVWREQRNYYAV